MLKKIANKVWKLDLDSNLYFLDIDHKIVIDTGDRFKRDSLQMLLPRIIAFDKVEKVILTHLHHDHIGNVDLFPNAKFFASKQEIKDFEENPEFSVLDVDILSKFKKAGVKLNSVTNMDGLKIISTPGHTRGSICIFYEKEKVLFTGDTYFHGEFDKKETMCIGRTDFPNSAPDEMKESLDKLNKIEFKYLCPGHDY